MPHEPGHFGFTGVGSAGQLVGDPQGGETDIAALIRDQLANAAAGNTGEQNISSQFGELAQVFGSLGLPPDAILALLLSSSGLPTELLEAFGLVPQAGATGGVAGPSGGEAAVNDFATILQTLTQLGLPLEQVLPLAIQTLTGVDAGGAGRDQQATDISRFIAETGAGLGFGELENLFANTGLRRDELAARQQQDQAGNALDAFTLGTEGALGVGSLQLGAGSGLGELGAILGRLNTNSAELQGTLTRDLGSLLSTQAQLGQQFATNPRNAIAAFFLEQGLAGNLPEFDLSRILGLDVNQLQGRFDESFDAAQGIVSPDVMDFLNQASDFFNQAGNTQVSSTDDIMSLLAGIASGGGGGATAGTVGAPNAATLAQIAAGVGGAPPAAGVQLTPAQLADFFGGSIPSNIVNTGGGGAVKVADPEVGAVSDQTILEILQGADSAFSGVTPTDGALKELLSGGVPAPTPTGPDLKRLLR